MQLDFLLVAIVQEFSSLQMRKPKSLPSALCKPCSGSPKYRLYHIYKCL